MPSNSDFLDPLLSPTYQDDGTSLTRRANINLIGFSVTDNPTTKSTDVTNTGSGAIAYANLDALRAAPHADKQVASVVDPIGQWVYDADSGAGDADDGYTIVMPDDVSLGANGRWYNLNTSTVLPDVAALRLAVSNTQATIQIKCHTNPNDGGGGFFDLDTSDTTSADDQGIIIVAGTLRRKRRFAGALHTEWFGVQADGFKLTDVTTTASDNVVESVSAIFTEDMIDRAALIRLPSLPASGTVTTVASNVFVQGAATDFLTDFPTVTGLGGVPMSGGAVYLNGEWLAVLVVVDDDTLWMVQAPTINASGQTIFTEVQIQTSVADVISPTELELDISGASVLFSLSNVHLLVATDDTDAREAAWVAGIDRKTKVIEPAGISGQSDNLYFPDFDGFSAEGQGWDKTFITDLRLASFETLLIDRVVDNYGLCSFYNSTNIAITKLSFDGSVAVLGTSHTTGGIENNSGGRIALFFRNCHDILIDRCGSGLDGSWGARDEHFYADSTSWYTGRNFQVTNCICLMTNNNTINPGGMGPGCVIKGNKASSYYSCLQLAIGGDALICDNLWSGRPDLFPNGTGADPVILEPPSSALSNGLGGSIKYCNNIHKDFALLTSGAACVTLFGIPGPADTTSQCEIHDNQYINCGGLFYTYAGIIHVINMPGRFQIHNETFDSCYTIATGGMFINISGSSTGQGSVANCKFGTGTNMTRAIVVESGVPDGVFQNLGGHTFGASITTRMELNAALKPTQELVTI